MSLFRLEVVQAQAQRQLGTIVVANRPASWAISAAVLAGVLALLALLWWGQYTRRVTVTGYLIPGAGVSRVHSPIAGRVQALYVHEGQAVQADTPLVTVVDERVGADGAEARASQARQIQLREASLRRSMAQQSALFARLRDGLSQRIAALAQEGEQLEAEIATQRARLRLAEANRSRHGELARQGFVSASTEQAVAEAALDQRARLQSLERNRTALQRERLALQAELTALPMREQGQVAELERALTEAVQEGIENRARAAVRVLAPQAGRVSALAVEVGQPVSPERPLLTLVPEGAALEAHLFAPSRSIGFVLPGQAVALRIGAFPYQKFGHQAGVVTEVARSPLGPAELAYPIGAPADAPALQPAPTEPLFRIRVRLARPTALAYGQARALQPGMQLDADLLLERRSLFEWIFEAAYSLRGKVAP